MTPAEELREAAALMRKRAEAATAGPWRHMCMGSEGCLVLRAEGTLRERGRGRIARFGQKDWHSDDADAEYVAGMHPAVALAVADWLDAEAADLDDIAAGPYGPGGAEFAAGLHGGELHPALAVARAYMGTKETSDEHA